VKTSDDDLDALRQALNRRLTALRRSIDGTSDSRRPVELDQASVGRLSRVDAMQMQAMAQAAERMRGQEINRINATLRRLEGGEYGYCITCGEDIAPERLAIDPTIATCFHCASGADS
jgi:DnaK suppressor protein